MARETTPYYIENNKDVILVDAVSLDNARYLAKKNFRKRGTTYSGKFEIRPATDADIVWVGKWQKELNGELPPKAESRLNIILAANPNAYIDLFVPQQSTTTVTV
jgi:hypothetical protein